MTITATPRDRHGARLDLSPQFRVDHAKRLVRLAEQGKRINPDELRRARQLLRAIREAA